MKCTWVAWLGGGVIVNYCSIGDYIHILDDALAIDKSSRIIGLRRDILNPYRYQLTIDDTYQVSIITQIIESQKEVQKVIKINDLRTQTGHGWIRRQLFLPLQEISVDVERWG